MRTTPEPRTRAETIRAHPVLGYFLLAYAISWAGALGIAWPYLSNWRPVPKMSGLMMFPVMLLGPSIAGFVLTGILQGKEGLKELRSRMGRIGDFRWLAVVAIPPFLVLAVLLGL